MIIAWSTGNVVAVAVGGIVGVVAIALVFYAIGRSEDRDRAAASAAPSTEEPGGEEGTAGEARAPDSDHPRLAPSRRRRRRP